MKPGETVSSSAALALSWSFTANAEGCLSNAQLASAAGVESVKLLKQLVQTTEELLVAVRALDITSLDETRDAVRELLKSEFGLTRAGK